MLADGRRSSNSRVTWLVVGLLLLAGLAAEEVKLGLGRFAIDAAVGSVREHLRRTRFVSADWKNPKLVYSNDPIRIRMVDDLLRRRRLVGMSRLEVLKLLGRPDYRFGARHYYFYFLGPERGWLQIDDEMPMLDFGGSDRVISAGTTRK